MINNLCNHIRNHSLSVMTSENVEHLTYLIKGTVKQHLTRCWDFDAD